MGRAGRRRGKGREVGEVAQRWCRGRGLCLILFDIIGPLSRERVFWLLGGEWTVRVAGQKPGGGEGAAAMVQARQDGR